MIVIFFYLSQDTHFSVKKLFVRKVNAQYFILLLNSLLIYKMKDLKDY